MSVIVIFLLILPVFYFSEIFVNVIVVKSSDISYKTVFILLQLLYLKIINDYKETNRYEGKANLQTVLQISNFFIHKINCIQ